MAREEKAICLRLFEARRSLGCSRAEFARRVGLSPFLLASYELGRSQLNYPAAYKILTAFPKLNPRWLAGEPGGMFSANGIRYPPPENFGQRTPFSMVFSELVRSGTLASQLELNKCDFSSWFTLPDHAMGRLRGEKFISAFVRQWLASLKGEDVNNFLNSLVYCAEKLLAAYPQHSYAETASRTIEVDQLLAVQVQERDSTRADSSKTRVDTFAGYGNIATVNQRLPELLERLNKAVEAPGKMTELANFLGEHLASVSRWLSGKREPGGETTLRLLLWVEQQERQQNKNPGGAVTSPGPKTRSRKSKHEKPKSSPDGT